MSQVVNIHDHFDFVERSHGPCLLHKTAPVWIVRYNAYPHVKQPEHWQVYFSNCAGERRDPWTCNNYSIGQHGKKFLFRSEAAAVEAALKKVVELEEFKRRK